MNQEKKREIIEKFTENLNKKEKINELAVIGREEEIEQLICILSRMMKNKPLLVGHPGVGKTAIVEGLVQRIKQERVPDYLKGKTVYQLDMMSLRAGTKFQGELEERLKAILNFMAQPENNAILFIDEIHMIVGDRGDQEVLNIANLLKPMLSRGDIQCIGATTQEEYRKYIEKDRALTRRFSNILVNEPSLDETLRILHGIRNYFEIYYELKICDEALVAAVKLSQRYLTTTYLPDKAIDLLDETCGRVRSEMWREPAVIKKEYQKLRELEMNLTATKNKAKEIILQQEIKDQKKKLEKLVKQNDQENMVIQKLSLTKKKLARTEEEMANFTSASKKEFDLVKASKIRHFTIPMLKEGIKKLEEEASNNVLRKYFIDRREILKTIAIKCDLSIEKNLIDEWEKLFFLTATLQEKVKGQDKALQVVSDAIFRAWTKIQDPIRPLASFLFVGPTGVGKTLVALTIAEQLFDQKKNLIRLDMTEFSEPHSISKLIGSPPGYIGHENKPRLEIIREKMHSVVLFDEIEKADLEVVNILLQILDNGLLTLANGKEINFRNTIIIMTTNLGSELYLEGKKENGLQEELEFEVKNHFRPEFLNRLDEVVFFDSLNKTVVYEIVAKELEEFVSRVEQEKNIKLKYNEKVLKKILQESYSIEHGARSVKHYIEKKIGSLIGRGIVFKFLRTGGSYLIDTEEKTDEIKITTLSLLETRI
ncbi:AAA family ATPase [endosymbiont GvMRE of Glomus versiforme]|uniref:AAA family ATPase n=1 Tax=endosymbiont GvMRE of Glomus versiforme TaxID=2039283 RepID=UPI000EC9EDC1|nr:ATP-dependent Clp protease ATP-binding subunit [endosymbiont GvMRE of Glomus versiforme]RHZ35394.1 Chaperone ClpB 2 [endosymbiont GvMRE of Glomus versiforme]